MIICFQYSLTFPKKIINALKIMVTFDHLNFLGPLTIFTSYMDYTISFIYNDEWTQTDLTEKQASTCGICRFFAVLTEGSVSIGNQTPEFAHFTGD